MGCCATIIAARCDAARLFNHTGSVRLGGGRISWESRRRKAVSDIPPHKIPPEGGIFGLSCTHSSRDEGYMHHVIHLIPCTPPDGYIPAQSRRRAMRTASRGRDDGRPRPSVPPRAPPCGARHAWRFHEAVRPVWHPPRVQMLSEPTVSRASRPKRGRPLRLVLLKRIGAPT